MSSTRLEQLRAMLAEDPGDHFLRYAIALEMRRAGNMEQAIADLQQLLVEDPKYIACYYQLAMLLAETGRTDDAVHVCEAGAMQCIVTRDTKARGELMQLRMALVGDDDED